MTAISYHDSVGDLQDPIFRSGGPFASLSWFALLEEAGHVPLMATARDGEEAICLPLARSNGGLAALTNWYAFTWQPLASAAVTRNVLDSLTRDLARHTRRIELGKVPGENGCATWLEVSFRKAGWRVIVTQCDSNHVLALAGRSYTQYLAGRPGSLRTTLDRKARKVETAISTEFEIDDWQSYESIYRESWKPEEGDPIMLRKFAQNQSAAGHYRLGLARHEGEPVAAQFWTVEGGTAYIHKLAHRECAKTLSPGTTLTASMFRHVIERDKVAHVDFGTGDEPYKRDWMEQVRPRWQLTCLRPNDPRNWPAIAKAALRELVSRRRNG